MVHVLPNRFMGVLGQHDDFPIENLTKSHCNKYLASCSHDQHIKFWNIEDVENIKVDASKKPKNSHKNKNIGKTAARNDFFAGLEENDEGNETDEDDDDDMDSSGSSDVTHTDGESEASYDIIEADEALDKDEIAEEGPSKIS